MRTVLAVGDMAFQKKCLDKMRSAATVEGKTVLYVSHNMNTIRQLCDRCVVLDKGRIIFNGDVEQAINIYLEHGNSDLESSINLAEKDHGGMVENKVATMERLCITGCDAPQYAMGQNISVDMMLNIHRLSDDLCLRTMIYFEDEQPVGMITTLCGQMALPMGSQTIGLTLPTELLAPGHYYLKLAL